HLVRVFTEPRGWAPVHHALAVDGERQCNGRLRQLLDQPERSSLFVLRGTPDVVHGGGRHSRRVEPCRYFGARLVRNPALDQGGELFTPGNSVGIRRETWVVCERRQVERVAEPGEEAVVSRGAPSVRASPRDNA